MPAAEFTVENCLRFLEANGYVATNTPAGGVLRLETVAAEENTLCNGLSGLYTNGIHIGSIFLILGVSFLGTVIPAASRCIPAMGRYPFVFVLAKTAATGVLLSVSTIHLLHEGAMAFREECMNETLKLYEPAYFLFALVAVLLMQMLDIQLGEIAERWMKAQAAAEEEPSGAALDAEGSGSQPQVERSASAEAVGMSRAVQDLDDAECEAVVTPTTTVLDEPVENEQDDDRLSARSHAAKGRTAKAAASQLTEELELHVRVKDEEGAAHCHQHLAVRVPRDMGSIRRVISAICMEFGVTLHSVFVGLAIGLTTDAELKPLLVALVFHQLFEGMAMGSRLADAEFKGSLELILALVFSVSAPVGMAAATIAVSVSRDAMSGTGFVTLMGVLDSLCGGILLYLAFTLLLGDFVADMKHYCAEGQPLRVWKKIGLFLALWIGMGLMALVGNWL